MPVQPVQQSTTWKMRAPMIPPTTPQNAMAFASASLTRGITSLVESHTPKKMPTAVKMPCQASVIGPIAMFGSRSMTITAYLPWHFLNFLPEPHQHGSLRPIFLFSGPVAEPGGRVLEVGASRLVRRSARPVLDVPLPLVLVVLVVVPFCFSASSCSSCSAVFTETRMTDCPTP